MADPIRFGGVAFQPSLARPAAVGGTGFASKLGAPGLGAALATGVQTLGREVVKAALSGMPPVVQNLAQNAAGGALGALTGGDAASLDLVDKTRFLIMMNAIFDASNAPIVEKT